MVKIFYLFLFSFSLPPISLLLSPVYVYIGTTAGKCNIMGYWHIGNTDLAFTSPPLSVREIETDICTDVCTVSKCGFDSSSSPRVDHITRFPRTPLVDFAISEVPFTAADYQAYPDLQMYPAFAGAVVPIYNIPELLDSTVPLVLSRATIANIFLGKISFWDDSRILADNTNTNVTAILSTLHKPIEVVVRHDSSGTSEIFTQSLSSFDPKTTGV